MIPAELAIGLLLAIAITCLIGSLAACDQAERKGRGW